MKKGFIIALIILLCGATPSVALAQSAMPDPALLQYIQQRLTNLEKLTGRERLPIDIGVANGERFIKAQPAEQGVEIVVWGALSASMQKDLARLFDRLESAIAKLDSVLTVAGRPTCPDLARELLSSPVANAATTQGLFVASSKEEVVACAEATVPSGDLLPMLGNNHKIWYLVVRKPPNRQQESASAAGSSSPR